MKESERGKRERDERGSRRKGGGEGMQMGYKSCILPITR